MSQHFAYIILGHKEPKQIAKLVSTLSHPDDYFFIHIDRKAAILPFIEAVAEEKVSNIHFIKKRENGQWGGFGIVQATLNAIDEIVKSGVSFCHVHLLSGQDFPIKKNDEIRAFFAESSKKDFIQYEAFPVSHLNGGGWYRIQNYSWSFLGKRLTYLPSHLNNSFNFKGKLINTFLGIIETFLPKRTFPKSMKPFYGSQWWSLSNDTITSIHEFLQKNKDYIDFHKHSLLPDEMFFQSIVMCLNNDQTTVNDNKRYILWEKGSSHPVTLKTENFPDIASSNAFFARKFEETEGILNLI